MKKLIYSFATLSVAAGMVFLSSCKTDEVKPGNPNSSNKPSAVVTFLSANYGIQKDFQVKADVSTQGDSAFISISVDGTKPTGAIYMMYQKDVEKAVKFTKHPNGTALPGGGYKGYAFNGTTGGTAFGLSPIGDFTFNIPSSLKNAWKLVIPILLRKDATSKSDVFTIWVTQDGKPGEFKNPAKNIAYGVATVTLNYTTEKLINYYETTLGNPVDAIGSLFSTQYGSNYKRKTVQDTLTEIGKTIDFVYNTAGGIVASPIYIFGSFYNSAGIDSDVKSGFGDVTNITNVTKIATVSGTSTTFDGINGEASLISAVDAAITSTTTTTKVTYTGTLASGTTFAFVTAGGKKGLVKILSATGTGSNSDATQNVPNGIAGTPGQAMLEVKVQR